MVTLPATSQPPMSLGELLAGFAPVSQAANFPISGLTADSRQVQPGMLFVIEPLPGHPGQQWVDAALAAGAVAVLHDQELKLAPQTVPCVAVAGLKRRLGEIAARFHGHPGRQLAVTGVTGTDGKTSVAWLLAQVRDLLGETSGLLGTLGYGLWDALEPGLHTTPPALITQAWLARLRAAGADCLSMEVSSHGLDQGRVAGVDFDTAILTNLGRDHLDYHGSLAAYAAAKRQLFEQPGLRLAVLNTDDAFGRELLERLGAPLELIAYGLEEPPRGRWRRLWARSLRLRASGLALELAGDFGEHRVSVPLLGRFNASNLLAVLAALAGSGVTLARVIEALAALRPPPGRMECFSSPGQPLVVVDYAHTPGALDAALAALRAHRPGELACVFGCGGERDRGKRALMARAAAAAADRVIVTDDNPRGEAPQQIIDDIVAGLGETPHVVCRDRAEAIARAIDSDCDTVLVAGKGHETVQIIGAERRPWSDRDAVARLLSQRAEVAHA